MKSLYIIACCLFLAAIASNLTSQRHYGKSAIALAKGTAAMVRAESKSAADIERTRARESSQAELWMGQRYGIAGLMAAGLGAAAWLASYARGRREGRHLTPLFPAILCVVYAMNLFAMV